MGGPWENTNIFFLFLNLALPLNTSFWDVIDSRRVSCIAKVTPRGSDKLQYIYSNKCKIFPSLVF